MILGVLCLSLLVLVVDNTVLNVAIPTLVSDLHASSSDIQWIIDAYILVFAGLLLTAGSLSDRHGRRRGLIIGLIVFGGASLAASFAHSPGQLIATRALMGIGGAFLMPGTLSILTTVFDDKERKKAIAIWSSVLTLGAVGGPTLGGLLLAHFWWGSVFLLNVPIAALGIIAALAIIPESRGPAMRPDPVGALLSMVGMTSLVWGVINAGKYGMGSAQTLGGFGVAVVVLTLFALWERQSTHPMLPMALFSNRNFSGASLSIVLLSFAAGGVMLALTQYLQFVLGFTPLRAGFALAPLLAAAIVFNGIGVVVDKKFGVRAAAAIGLGLLAVGFGVLATISMADGYGKLVVALVIIGAGSGTAGPGLYGTLLGALPHDRAGVGSAVNDTVQQVGQALSVAILGSVLTAAFSAAMPDDVTGPARHSIGEALGVAAATGDAGLAHVAREAFVKAMSIASIAGLVGAVGAVVLAAAVLRPKPQPAAEPVPERQPEPDASPL
ncbi:MFS transporter [Rugosimonospora africana]|uniref:MFS transporter n=1 Tax=Rugosimonospora africana TaxID=556532 RepID=A0A8J3QNJ0_9ACTN|nr:MFS transporter [Rugosimonospora africana]